MGGILLKQKMRTWFVLLLGLVWIGTAAQATPEPQSQDALVYGVFPNVSPRTLIETHHGVADVIERKFGRKVDLRTASGFLEFYQRTQAGEFDLVLTPPHFAWLAWKQAGYRPLLSFNQPVRGLVVVRKDSGIKSLSQLKGKRVAMVDPLAIVTMRGLALLQRGGLGTGSYSRINANTHNNAALQVHVKAADAAVMGALPFNTLPSEVKAQLHVLAETEPLPSQVLLVGKRVSPDGEEHVRQILLAYMQTPAGNQFLSKGGLGGLHRLTRTELDKVRQDARQVERLIADQMKTTPEVAKP